MLIADTANTLILMGTKDGLTVSWRFRILGNGSLEQIGKRIDEGILMSEPHHSSRSAVMLQDDLIFIREISHRGFFEADILSEL